MNIEIPNTLSRHVWSLMFERRTVRELGDQVRLSAQQKQSDDGEDGSDDRIPKPRCHSLDLLMKSTTCEETLYVITIPRSLDGLTPKELISSTGWSQLDLNFTRLKRTPEATGTIELKEAGRIVHGMN